MIRGGAGGRSSTKSIRGYLVWKSLHVLVQKTGVKGDQQKYDITSLLVKCIMGIYHLSEFYHELVYCIGYVLISKRILHFYSEITAF